MSEEAKAAFEKFEDSGFLPRMSGAYFRSALAVADVVLDGIERLDVSTIESLPEPPGA